jgi:hypothetical protein
VKNVFIPAESVRGRGEEDRSKFGAESIGGKLIDGALEDLVKAMTANVTTTTDPAPPLFFEKFAGIMNLPRGRLATGIIVDDPIREVSGEGYTRGGPANRRQRRTRPASKKPRRDPPKKPGRLCPRHGGPAANCRACWR